MNGLQGGYSQILINGRPVFSPLMGLYGMEQLPVHMIDKIEVVRGGASSLYGSSAIGGTVNVITKLPRKNGYEINTFYQNIGGQTHDFNLGGNATLVNDQKNAGMTMFLNKRDRGYYDANGDNFSEIPKAENTSLGFNVFRKINENHKIEFSVSNLNEYRYGGEMVEKPAYLTLQSEERSHRIWMGSFDYQINMNHDKTSLIFYTAMQDTRRNHYTGIFPEENESVKQHLENPPYGNSTNTTFQTGVQFNQEIERFLGGRNVLTLGSEYLSDKVLDKIPAYYYLVHQNTKDWGTFLQSDWDVFRSFNLLSGVRMDMHNFLDKWVLSPRLALMYKIKNSTQIRISYGSGFRAPQAFDTDLHIAFAGGGVSRVRLSPGLSQERSQSYTASINYDKATDKWVAGFTLEVFYTHLQDAFVLENTGEDDFGKIFVKKNGQGATVQGFVLELRANFNKIFQAETGFTFQNSRYSDAIEYIPNIKPTRGFLRTPDDYGFANLSFTPSRKWSFNVNYIYTGRMDLAHFGGAENFPDDMMVRTKSFSELNGKISYTFHLHKYGHDLEVYGGIKNFLNEYQNDFDKGKNRDSNYIYGPAMPGTFYLGVKIKTE